MYVHGRPTAQHVVDVPIFKATAPKVSGRISPFPYYKHELNRFAKSEGIERGFTMANDSSNDVEVGNTDLSVPFLEARNRRDVLATNI